MDWLTPVDIYCERTSAAFWAEPANALTNLSFVLAALWAAQVARRNGERDPLIWALIALAALIGVGSFLFHTFALRWSELSDTLPIWGFVTLFIYVAIGRLGGRTPPWPVALLLFAAFVGLAWLTTGEGAPASVAVPPDPLPDPLNGSGQYFPAIVALGVFGVLTWRRNHPMRDWIAGAAAVFALSLVFRTFDRDICASFPLGTHFLWHLFNGLMIALLLQSVLRSPPAPVSAGS